MLSTEAKKLLGFPPNSRPSSSQISEAYSCLKDDGTKFGSPMESTFVRVVRAGVPTGYGGRNRALIKTPFLLLIFGTVSLGGFNAARAYQRQKEAQPSYNPFLP